MRSTVALSFLLILTILHGLALGQTSDAVSLRLTLGLKDKEPTDWSGRMTVARGRVLRVDAGAPADEQAKPGTWTVRSRRQRQRGAVQPAQVLVTLAAAQQAKVRVETPQGTFSFTLAEVKSGSAIALLDGAVQVERMPFFAAIVTDPTEDDFPACATGADGAVWCTYVSYTHGPPIAMDQVREGSFDSLVPRGNGDQVKLIGFDGESWSAPIDITEPGLDVWRPTVAVDGRGDVWVIWARNIKGNWDIFARRCSSGSQEPGPIKRLTSAAGADTNAVAVTAGSGAGARVAIAWQAWRDGNFDIFVAELRRDGIGRPTRVSSSGANDWHPAIAATSNGDIWVAWDTYDRGNYDVMVRQWANGRLGDPIPVATSLRFEARPSIAVDSQDRLWIAYEDADANWGKDFGTRWPGRMGVPFYLERNVNVRCLAGGWLQAPKAQFRSDLIDTAYDDKTWETEKRQRISLPRLAVGGDGRVWLLCRRHPLTTAAQERWVSFATHYDGDAWAPQTLLPRSHNLLDNRPALVPLPDGRLAVAYSTDGRIAGPRDVRDNNLYTALLSAEGDAKPPVLVPASPAGDDGASPAPVHPAEAEDIARLQSYEVAAGAARYRLLRGEFHRHTEISSHRDWDGTLEAVWRYGLDVARMDWIGAGDHDYGGGREYTWWLTQKQTDMYHHPPTFVPMHTYERSVRYPSGHRNVMFTRRGIRALPRLGSGQKVLYGTPEEGSPDIENLYRYLKAFGGICASHTSATNMGTDWRDNDPDVEPVVEIYQGHRQSYEEPQAPLAAKSAEESIQGYHPDGFVWQALAKGYRLGFQASSDHVSTHLSYAVVLAERPTRAAILDAFKQRHCYGAHDNIVLDVRAGDRLMGDEFVARSPRPIDIVAIGTASIARVDIVRRVGDEAPMYVYATEPKQREVRMQWQDTDARPGQTNMYYVRIMQEDHKLAWASPLWIRYG